MSTEADLKKALESVIADRGEFAYCVRTGLYLLGTDPNSFNQLVRNIAVIEPRAASNLAWALSDVETVKLRGAA